MDGYDGQCDTEIASFKPWCLRVLVVKKAFREETAMESGKTLAARTPNKPGRRGPGWITLRAPIPARVYWGAGVAFLLGLLCFWAILTYSGAVDPLFLPTPTAVLQEAVQQIRTGVLWKDMSVSVSRVMVGWLLSTLIAIPLGALMGNFKFFEGLFEPFIDLVRYMPAVAFVPLSILWTGVGDGQKFLIIFIGTFFQQVLMVMDNVKTVPPELIRVASTLGRSDWETLREVIVPAALPGIVDTLRITLGWAWTYLVVAELVAAQTGLGFRIMQAQRFLATARLILGILVIGILGLICDLSFKLLYRWLFPYMRGRGA